MELVESGYYVYILENSQTSYCLFVLSCKYDKRQS